MSSFYDDYWQRQDAELGDFSFKWPVVRRFIPSGKVLILDFGCGKGRMTQEISRANPQAEIIGIDVSVQALKEAKKTVTRARFVPLKEDGRIPLEDGSVDFIIMADVIEHIYDVNTAAREVSRVLKSSGRVLITTPYHGFLKNLILITFWFDTAFDPTGPHIRFFSKSSLLRLLASVGLKEVEFGHFGRFYPVSRAMYVLATKSHRK